MWRDTKGSTWQRIWTIQSRRQSCLTAANFDASFNPIVFSISHPPDPCGPFAPQVVPAAVWQPLWETSGVSAHMGWQPRMVPWPLPVKKNVKKWWPKLNWCISPRCAKEIGFDEICKMLLLDSGVPPLLPAACFGVAAPDEIPPSLASEKGLPKPTTEFVTAIR